MNATFLALRRARAPLQIFATAAFPIWLKTTVPALQTPNFSIFLRRCSMSRPAITFETLSKSAESVGGSADPPQTLGGCVRV